MYKPTYIFVIIICLSILGFSCYNTKNIQSNSTTTTRVDKTLPTSKIKVHTDGNGTYEEVTVEERPDPIQGHKEWVMDFYGQIKYPPSARENGIQGVVILDVLINEVGQVERVEILSGISPDCDKNAREAFLKSTVLGYEPLVWENSPVKYKLEVPVGFWLE